MEQYGKRKRRRMIPAKSRKAEADRRKVETEIDPIAMIGAGMDIMEWKQIPEYHRQVYRSRAREALKVMGGE
jgi:hypothetical protein